MIKVAVSFGYALFIFISDCCVKVIDGLNFLRRILIRVIFGAKYVYFEPDWTKLEYFAQTIIIIYFALKLNLCMYVACSQSQNVHIKSASHYKISGRFVQ